jgi:hypothetical protein
MGLNRVGAFVFVALVSALLTWYLTQLGGGGRCDIHPQVSQSGLSAIRNNAERARTTAYNAIFAEKHDKDAANLAAEQAGLESFVYDLREAVGAEYFRHRRAMDNCY